MSTVSAALAFSTPGMSEFLLIGVIALLVFGGKKFPEIARGLGKGIRQFNRAKNDIQREIENMDRVDYTPSKPTPSTDNPTTTRDEHQSDYTDDQDY